MPIIHHYVDGATTPCGLPIEGGDPAFSRDLDRVDCGNCLFALLPQGGPYRILRWALLRVQQANPSLEVCRCEPCITFRVVLARFNLWPHGLAATDDADHPDYPGYKVCLGCRGPDDGHFPDCLVQLFEKRREATPEDDQRIGRWLAEKALVIPPVSGCPENNGGEHIFSLHTAGLYCTACREYLVKVA